MRYKGLLTFEEADKCIAEGYDSEGFVAYRLSGYRESVYSYSGVWYNDNDSVKVEEYQGLAPTLGNPLPFCEISTDGRIIVIQTKLGEMFEARFVKRYFVSESEGHCYDVQELEGWGWYPRVSKER